MKQQKNIISAKATTAISLLKLLSLVLILTVLSGGDSFAGERQKYKVIVTRPGKNITTQLRVFAENKEEARENVALNGWQILSIEEYMEPGSVQLRGAEDGTSYKVNITKVGSGKVDPMGDVAVADGDSLQISLMPGPCEKLSKVLYNGQETSPSGPEYTIDSVTSDGYVVVVFDQNGTECADQGIFSNNLKEIGAIYFDLGKFQKKLTDEEKQAVTSAMDKSVFVIIGHTDDVKVIPNDKYKDNFQLSVERAQFTLNKLKEKGYKADTIKIIGLGPAFPAAPNKEGGSL